MSTELRPPWRPPGPKTIRVPKADGSLPLYSFDGGKAQRGFTADLFAMGGVGRPGGDGMAGQVIRHFVQNDLAAVFSNISQANVATLNPTTPRVDLYNPGPRFSRPLWGLTSTAPLDSALSMEIPRFSSGSGLAGEHVEGTEPTPGSFVIANQTVVPKPISGELILNREILDFGDDAALDMIVFGKMLAVWAETIEKRIAAALDALAPTTAALVGTDTDLADGWDDLLAPLPFARGGLSLTSLALADGLYKATRAARDDAGRKLFPTGAGAVLDIAGQPGVPSWSLATANGGANNSYLFNPASVLSWATSPQEFGFDAVNVASVKIGLFGYSAHAIIDVADVVRLTYATS